MKFATPFPVIKTTKIKKPKLKKIIKPIIYAFAIIGVVSIFTIFNLISLVNGSSKIVIPPIPKNAIISIDFNQYYQESKTDNLLAELDGAKSNLTYFDLIKNINIAMLDNNVKAIIANINITGLGLSQIENLRNAIQNFRNHGKKAYIFSSGMGSLGQGTDEYFLASAFDKIYMQPNSDLGITGIGIEIPFLNKGLNKLGLDAEFYTRHEYKNAASSLTHSYFPWQYKEQLNYIGDKIFQTMVDEIENSRNIRSADVKTQINKAPLSAEEAKASNLIDEIAYYSDVEEQIKKEFNGEIIKLTDYAANYTSPSKNLPTIAYLALDGTIVEGETANNSLSGELTVGAETIVKNIKAIAKNKNIKALILRINSPGGSYTASNTIWYELNKLKQTKNIPIVVSMGDYAASGGYFVALSGDKILAQPTTVTGSIGVLGGKIVTADLWKKLDINWGIIQFGQNAGIVSTNHKFSDAEKQAFNKSLDNIYKDFTQKVSSSRNIEITALDKIARGRVWLGIDAVDNGLVDEIGGINEALQTAKNLAKIEATEKFSIAFYPQPKTFAEKINELLQKSPQISINQLANKMGLDIQGLNVLQRMQYDCILTPFMINM